VPRCFPDAHDESASWGKEHVGPEIHSVLNRTPLSATTNRHVVGKDLPNVYLKRLFDNNDALDAHYISTEATIVLLRQEFRPKDFHEFLHLRQQSLIGGIESVLINEAVHSEVLLPHLNDAIEKIELSLWRAIANTVGADPSRLPIQAAEKPKQRIATLLKKRCHKKSDAIRDYSGGLLICTEYWNEPFGLDHSRSDF
jgi:hypothetical protein